MRESTTVQVVAESLTRRERSSLDAAIQAVNGLQSQFVVSVRIRPIQLPGKRFAKVSSSFDTLERRAKQVRIFCVTPRPFRTNEFQLVNERCSLLTISDWEELYLKRVEADAKFAGNSVRTMVRYMRKEFHQPDKKQKT